MRYKQKNDPFYKTFQIYNSTIKNASFFRGEAAPLLSASAGGRRKNIVEGVKGTGLSILLFVCSLESLQSSSLFSLLLPDRTKESFCAFTTQFSRYLDEQYGAHSEGRKKVLLIADGAGAHQEKICTKSGFRFQKLPPASSELWSHRRLL